MTRFRTAFPVLLFSITLILSGCAIPLKSVVYLKPDLRDHKRMPYLTVNAPETPFTFYKSPDTTFGERVRVNDWSPAVVPLWRSLNELVQAHPNNALVIIRNDTILYEHYRHGKEKRHPSYSVAKSFTSALTGFAVQDSLLSLEDSVNRYLPEWSDDPRYRKLKVKHLLNHTSGIEHPLTVDGLLYYGNNLKRAKRHIRFKHRPGFNQAYMNMNIWMLGQILEKVTGGPLSSYLEEKIWIPLGMESDARWTASKRQRIKPYCCLQATARDYAKFGRLYLNGGEWQGEQLLDEAWVDGTLSRDTTDGGTFGYHNCWYLGYQRYSDAMAIGLYKQHIYIYPKKGIIMVSMNDRPRSRAQKALNWEDIFRQIVDQI